MGCQSLERCHVVSLASQNSEKKENTKNMNQKVRISKTEQAAAKRAAIIASPAFQTWWSARQNISPIPSDPYRAFMIDIGLYARPMRKEIWQHRTNRMDYPRVDLPKGLPRRKRRLPSRKELKRFKRVPKAAQPMTLTAFEKQLVGEVEKFEEKYHLPRAKIRFEPRARASFLPAVFGTPMILMPKEFVKMGEKGGGAAQQVAAVIFHEEGHHTHAAYGGIGKIAVKPIGLETEITSPYVLGGTIKERIKKERIAWRIAKKAKKPWTPIMAWTKKKAFGTYLGTTPLPTIILGQPKKKKRR